MEKIKEFIRISSGSGYGYGYGDGSGYGSGYGDGSGDGSGYGYGYGDGSGDGSGYGDGSGDGDGDGSGSGSGYGYGYGDGSGYGLKSLNGKPIYLIDNIQTIITSIRNNIAKGYIVNADLTLIPCYIVKRNNLFAHGETIKKAIEALENKLFNNLSEDERILAFISKFSKIDKKIKAIDLFDWHNKLTGSCEMGRQQFCIDKGIDVDTDSFTIVEFIKLTENSYGSQTILKVKERLKIK